MPTSENSSRLISRSATFITSVTLLGRVAERAAAFGQILLIAFFFGATTSADLYFIASIVPLTLGGIVGEALYASVLPSLSRRSDADAVSLACGGFWLSAAALVLATAGYVGVVALVIASARPAGSAALGPWLAFAPIGVLVGLGAYLSAVLLRFERYVWPPFRSAASAAVGLGLSGVALAFTSSVTWVAVAISTGYLVAFLLLSFEVLLATGTGLFGVPTRKALAQVFALRRTFAFSLSGGILGGQMFVFIERALASPLGVGAVASISYARGLAFTPGVISQSISLGIFPGMLRAHAGRDTVYLRRRYISGLRITLFVALLTAAFLALYSRSIAGLVFEQAALSGSSILEIHRALAVFALALVGSMMTIFTSRILGAVDWLKGIVVVQAVALALYIPLALTLRGPFETTGLALAFGLAELGGAFIAIVLSARRAHVTPAALFREVAFPAVARVAPPVAALALFKYGVAPAGHAASVGGGVAVGLVVASLSLWRSRWPELDVLRQVLKRLRLA